MTRSEHRYIGKVIFTSVKEGQKEGIATMLSTNSYAQQGVANLTDWVLIELEYHLGPIEMPDLEIRNRCNYVNGISHVPAQGYGAVVGAASRRADGRLWKADFSNAGVPYVMSKNRWRGKQKELQCWTLSYPKEVDKEEWFRCGVGISGDSGAAAVDCNTGKVCALIIDEVVSESAKPRKVLLNDMADVKADITRAAIEAAKINGPLSSNTGAPIPLANALIFGMVDANNGTEEATPAAGLCLDFEKADVPRCICEGLKEMENWVLRSSSIQRIIQEVGNLGDNENMPTEKPSVGGERRHYGGLLTRQNSREFFHLLPDTISLSLPFRELVSLFIHVDSEKLNLQADYRL